MEFYTHNQKDTIVPIVVIHKFWNGESEFCECIDISYCKFAKDIKEQTIPFLRPAQEIFDTPQEAFNNLLAKTREQQNLFCEELKEKFYDKYPKQEEVES